MLGSSKCKVMSVLDLKDTFHSLRLMENSKKFCGILPFLEALPTCTKDAYGIEYLPSHLAVLYKCNIKLLAK